MSEQSMANETTRPSDTESDPRDDVAPEEVAGTPDDGGDGAEPAGADAAAAAITQLEQELQEAIAQRQRARADFVNFQRRSAENEAQAIRNAIGNVVRSILPVLDHASLALSQDPANITVEQLMDGVRMVQSELIKALEMHRLAVVDPEPGEEFDPSRHQAVMRECTDRQPPDTVVAVLQVGYELDGLVLRPASVTVAAPEES